MPVTCIDPRISQIEAPFEANSDAGNDAEMLELSAAGSTIRLATPRYTSREMVNSNRMRDDAGRS
jgi:hypothetical protein